MKIAILGPKGTFTELALEKYKDKIKEEYICGYFSTINETVLALNNGYDMAIVPIENTLDGYVQRTLDLLLENDSYIIDQVTVPVQFKLVSDYPLNEIENLYVQFKAMGQCNNFINSLNNVKIINTDSNITSYILWNEHKEKTGAVVPVHLDVPAKYIYDNITDSKNNDTRFFVLTKETKYEIKKQDIIRVPLYIIPLDEYPGLLYNVLKVFNDNKINLTTILSRPKKIKMGEYNFYVEIVTSYDKYLTLLNEIKGLSDKFDIKVLGMIKE